MVEPAPVQRQKEVELPTRAFLYTLDQVAFILDMNVTTLKSGYIYYSGLSTGLGRKHLIQARDISDPLKSSREWRVAETELVRWMKLKGFRFKIGKRIVD